MIAKKRKKEHKHGPANQAIKNPNAIGALGFKFRG
jgi:hypothetical protein